MTDSARANHRDSQLAANRADSHTFHRSIGLFSATAINMTQMCGIGPFITIPLMVATMGGPQAILGWIAGAALAICRRAGVGRARRGDARCGRHVRVSARGVPVPDRQADAVPVHLDRRLTHPADHVHRHHRHGRSTWASSSRTGFWPDAPDRHRRRRRGLCSLLYRRIESVRPSPPRCGSSCCSGRRPDDRGLPTATSTPASPSPTRTARSAERFFAGLGAGLLIAIYDYLGYNTVAYMGDELSNPGRTMPRLDHHLDHRHHGHLPGAEHRRGRRRALAPGRPLDLGRLAGGHP